MRFFVALLVALCLPTLGLAQQLPAPSYRAVTVGGTTINGVGTTAGTVAAGNDNRLVNALQSGGAGDLSSMSVTPANGNAPSLLSALMAQRVVRGANDLTVNAYTGLPSLITFGNTDTKSYLYSYRTENQQSLLGTHAIVRNTPGSGYFGPASADFALLLGAKKDNWDTATGAAAKEGEIDTLVINGAQGKKGDIAGVLIDQAKRRDTLGSVAADENGAVMGLEVASSLVGADRKQYHRLHALTAFIEGPGGLSKGKGYGFFALSKIGNAYGAFTASVQPVGGVDQFGNVAPVNGWDNLIVNDATGAVDGSGVNFQVPANGRLLQGFPSARIDTGYDAALDAWTVVSGGMTLGAISRTTGVASLIARPIFGTATPWDSQNLNPALYAPLASPALIGIPTAPTAAAGTSTAQLATTAFATASAATRAAYTDWTSYTPTIGCISGSFGTPPTVLARYARVGNVLTLSARITTASSGNGTCAGGVTLPLPIAARYGMTLSGSEAAVSGKMLQGRTGVNGTVASLFTYDNVFPGGNSTDLFVSGSYEVSP